MAVIMTARGCNRKCLYCFQIDKYRKSGIRYRSVENVMAEVELVLAGDEWKEALSMVNEFLEVLGQKGMLAHVPPKLLLKGRILQQDGRSDEAHEVLREALAMAREQKVRPVLWQICALLADLEAERGKKTEAQLLREEAREAIDFMAGHAGRDDLRSSFLAIPQVETVLLETGGMLVDLKSSASK